MMGTLWNEGGEIHLPERWAVLEEALRQINAEGLRPAEGEAMIADSRGPRGLADDEPAGRGVS